MSTINLGPFESPLLDDSRAARTFSLPETLERAAGFLLLAAAAPVIATSAIAVAALSGRSPFIAHLRVAKEGKPFWMLKLRTMWPRGWRSGRWRRLDRTHHREIRTDSGKDPSDPRVSSWFASFCRRHSIDELPQLWHVACGEMSLVGPRPLTRAEIDRYYAEDAL